MPETRRITLGDIIQADDERVDQARFAALKEMLPEFRKVVGPKSFRKWRRDANKTFRAMLARSN